MEKFFTLIALLVGLGAFGQTNRIIPEGKIILQNGTELLVKNLYFEEGKVYFSANENKKSFLLDNCKEIYEKNGDDFVLIKDIDAPPPMAERRTLTDEHVVDKMPEYPAGEEALKNDLAKNFKTKGIVGTGTLRAAVEFTIGIDGEISSIRIRSSSGNAEFDQRVIKAVQKLKKFEPAMRNGGPVPFRYALPFAMYLD